MLIKKSEYYQIMNNTDNEELADYYYHNGNFESVAIKEDFRKNQYLIEAVFRARYYRNNIKISIDDFGHISNYKCDCPFCSDKQACAHVGATLQYVMNLSNTTSLPYYENSKRAQELEQEKQHNLMLQKRQYVVDSEETNILIDLFIDKMDESLTVYHQDSQIKIVSEIRTNDYFYGNQSYHLNYKIGTDKYYVIKNIQALLKSIEDEEVVRFGKNCTLKLMKNNFDEAALRQIAFFQKYLIQHNEGYVVKTLPLDEDILDDYYDLYSTMDRVYSNCNFTYELGNIEVKIESIVDNQEETFYKVAVLLGEEDYLYGKKHAYLFDHEHLTRYHFDDEGLCIALLRHFEFRDGMLMKQEELNRFYKYVLLNIEEYVVVDEILPYVVTEEVEQAKLFGDIDDDEHIRLTLNYTVKNKSYTGFNQAIIPLNIEKITKVIMRYNAYLDEETHQLLLDINEETTYVFVQEGLPLIKSWCEVFVSEALLNLGKPRKLHLQVGINIKEDLLNVELNSLDINKKDILEVLKSYRRKKKYHRLTNGVLLSLQSQELEELDQLLDKLNFNANDFKEASLSLPTYRAFALNEALEDSSLIQVQRETRFNEFLTKFKATSTEEVTIPERYFNLLRDYQKEGVYWLKKISDYGFGGILADDMGLGKTLQMITYLEMQKKQGQHLVICPASLLLNWQDEINKFNSSLKTLCLYGSANVRSELIQQIKEVQVVITSYDYLRRDIDLLKEVIFETIILDEAQYIKNQKTKNALSVKLLKAKHRFALTGTPIENSLAELWSIFDFLMPNYLYSYHYFQKNYEKAIVKEQDEDKQKLLKRLVEPFILRRNKSEVLTELPEKVENTYILQFNEEEKNMYYANLMQVNEELQSKLDIDKVDKIKVLAMLTRLRQICCEPRMVYDNIKTTSSKLEGCMELIDALHYSERKVLLFSSFTSALDLIAVELDKRKIKYLMLTGKTDKVDRKKYVDQFQSDNTTVFLISLKAGGTGLNLTAAQAVIHYDPWWNVSAQNQATDRAYRIGQERNVQVFKLIMKDSIEEKIQVLQEKKKNLADAFVEGNSGSLTSMSMDEIIDLLKI